MSTNFAFMKEIAPAFYSNLVDIEHDARIQPKEASRNCRELLEAIVKYALGSRYSEKGLNESIVVWRKDPKLNYPYKVDKSIEYMGVDKDGKTSIQTMKGITFIRLLGNNATHGYDFESHPVTPLICCESVFVALHVFYDYFTWLYRKQVSEVEPFAEEKIPIGEYEYKNEYEPADSDRTKCVKEYLATLKPSPNSKRELYALIREYVPDSLDELYLDRNMDAFAEIYGRTYSNGVLIKNLNKIDEPCANYFIAYEFPSVFTTLEHHLNKFALSMTDRLSICLQIAEAVKQFHTARNPVYHRALSYESILLSKEEGGEHSYRPYVVKFDFAKLTGIDGGTVFKHLSDAEMKESMKLARYRIDDITPETKWDKVDIYSLGVLFVDVLLNKVSSTEINAAAFDKLAAEGISDEMLDMIDLMLNQIPEERPDISSVVEMINKEYSRHD